MSAAEANQASHPRGAIMRLVEIKLEPQLAALPADVAALLAEAQRQLRQFDAQFQVAQQAYEAKRYADIRAGVPVPELAQRTHVYKFNPQQ